MSIMPATEKTGNIHFTAERWDKIKADARAWWKGELKRPLLQLRVHGHEAERAPAVHPYHHFTAFYDLDIPAEEVVDVWDHALSQERFYGDAFPAIWPNFGPGVLASFLGAELGRGENTVWFHPTKKQEVCDLKINYDETNVWLNRVRDIMTAAAQRWEGMVQVGMTDLGGVLDVLSSFRPSEELLLDLYDEPEAVKERTWEIYKCWHKAFDYLDKVQRQYNPGYTAWTPIFSEEPYYMLQCDFCYMIGPDMFDEFVKPELAESCKKLVNPFYHLDGPGELAHLDSLLEIEELKGVQWVPGDGSKAIDQWPEVFRKIRGAGKLAQVMDGWNPKDDVSAFERIVDQLGSAEGLVMLMHCRKGADEEKALRMLEKFGVL
ncbi:MAG: hypothetical protein JXR97_00545 [Planctomycetes bacterium]|nr:hypothetical protein [Planctomycetota bacterium]